MKTILNNPYRTLGFLAGSTAREQIRQIRRLKNYISAGQEPEDDFSFPVLGKIHRTIESVEDSESKLNLNNDKINAALFWFWNGNPITDEPAFEALKSGNIDSACEIWEKLITQQNEEGKKTWKAINEKNYSAYHNYSIINLISANGNLNNSIKAQLYFLESNLIQKFTSSIADETYKTNKKELQLLFLNQLYAEYASNKKVSLEKFLEILNQVEFAAKKDFLKTIADNIIEQIEHKIDATKSKRKTNKANAAKAGQELFNNTAIDLKQLKSIVGASDLKYTSTSDKVANEILQCGIDYFTYYRDSSIDPGSDSMDLFRKAQNIAVGNIAKQRCQENIKNLQEWIDNKPIRDKQARIFNDLERLKNLIDENESKSETVSNAKQLLESARPFLNNVKSILGITDELYLGISSRIASDALGMCVSEINMLQKRFSNSYDNMTKLSIIRLLKDRVNEAWNVTNIISKMDLRQDFRTRLNQNITSLSNLKNQLDGLNIGGGSGGGAGGGGGCYIATMAYGSYDHPQVLILRKFRDDVLVKNMFGRILISYYYFISPKLVVFLKNQNKVNALIRKALNQFIKIIK